MSAAIAADIVPLGPYGGDVRSLAVHPARPSEFFLGTSDGQIYVSRNAGATWNRLVPGLNRRNQVVDSLVFDPRDPDILYAATWELKSSRGWFFRSTDGGQSWDDIPLGRYQSSIRAVAIAPSEPDVIALGINEGVILSIDGGRTWERISRGYRSLYNVHSLAFDPVDSQTLYVGTFRLGWKTNDRGQKWQPIHQGMLFDSDLFTFLVHPRRPDILYASACTGVWKSENAGGSWARLENGLPRDSRRTRALHLDPSDPDTVYAGTTRGFFASDDAGRSWRRLLSDLTVNAILAHPSDREVILVGADDVGILRSADGGKTFQPAIEGFIHRQISALGTDPRSAQVYFASVAKDRHFGGFFVSLDAGQQWTAFNDGLPASALADIRAILPAPRSSRVFLATAAGVYTGVPLEKPWQLIESTARLPVLDLTFAGGEASSLFLATSKGVSLLDLEAAKLKNLSIPDHQGPVTTVLYDPDTGLLFAGTYSHLYRSSDRGRTWSVSAGGLPSARINVLVKAGPRLFAGTRAGLYWSQDDGESWGRAQGVFPIDIVTVSTNPLEGDQLYAADLLVGYLFRSDDGGQTWSVLNEASRSSRISSLAFAASGDLLVGTISDGVNRMTRLQAAAGGQ